jgi:hypothetical protein
LHSVAGMANTGGMGFAALLTAVALTGCGSQVTVTGAGGQGGQGGAGGQGSDPDLEYICLLEVSASPTHERFSVAFVAIDPDQPQSDIVLGEYGDCVAFQTEPSAEARELMHFDGGTITITTDERQQLKFPFHSDEPAPGYDVFENDLPFPYWSTTMFFAGTGGDSVPYISALANGPAAITVGAPLPSSIERALDYPLVWTGGTIGTTWFVITSTANGSRRSVRCEWDAAVGQGFVPSAALAHLPTGDLGTLVGGTVHTTVLTKSQGWTVKATMGYAALTPDAATFEASDITVF